MLPDSELSEQRLLEELQSASTALQAVEQRLAEFATSIRNFLRQHYPLVSSDMLDDATQEAIVATIEHLRSGRPIDSLNFVRVSARNRLIDIMRKAQKDRRLVDPEQLPLTIREREDESAFVSQTPLESQLSNLRSAMHVLNEQEKAILILRFQCGWKLRQIAEALSIPLSTISAKIFTCLARLRKEIEMKKQF